MTEYKKGIVSAFLAYIFWGLFPLYWKMLEHVDSLEILVNRILWSFVFTVIFIILIKQRILLIEDLKALWKNKKQFFSLVGASFTVTCNWFIYIWAVNHGHVIDTSLGYYINPLITVLFGMIFFKEKLSKAQFLAVLIAFIGVLVMSINYGKVPWIALLLALSFAIYGALKKQIKLDSTRGLAIETAFIVPIALIYYIYLMTQKEIALFHIHWSTDVLLILAGIVTAYPLILFAKGAKALPQYVIGFIQYVSPTIALFLGILLYHEPFTKADFTAFSFIWTAIIVFSLSTIYETRKKHLKHKLL